MAFGVMGSAKDEEPELPEEQGVITAKRYPASLKPLQDIFAVKAIY